MQIYRRQICPTEAMIKNKIHPDHQTTTTVVSGTGDDEPSSPSTTYLTTEQESFTIWMKSLVYNSNGCTVFDSKGNIIYRVDNYNCKSCSEVYLMDLYGHVLFTLRRKKKFGFLKYWEGYRSYESTTKIKYFRMRKNYFRVKNRDSSSSYKVNAGFSSNDEKCWYKIVNYGSSFGIEEESGRMVANVKRKESKNGLKLGEDVLNMTVESQIDHSFVIGLVLAYSLINSKL